GRLKRLIGNFQKHPDVAMAAHVGEPALTTPDMTSAPEILQRIGKAALGGGSEGSQAITVEKIGTGTPPPNDPTPRSDQPPAPPPATVPPTNAVSPANARPVAPAPPAAPDPNAIPDLAATPGAVVSPSQPAAQPAPPPVAQPAPT